jgi:hypothetical protein
LTCERSPQFRRKKGNFDYKPPPPLKEEPKWKYPQNDYGILSKLDSQKQIFEDMFKMERDYNEHVEMKKQYFEKRMAERQKANASSCSAPSHPDWESNNQDPERSQRATEMNNSYLHVKPATESLDQLIRNYEDEAGIKHTKVFSRKLNNSKPPKSKMGTRTYKSFYEQPISTFKAVGHSNPEMLADWRAKRAADFVDKQSDPLGLTLYSEEDGDAWETRPHPAFRPAGINKDVTRSKKLNTHSMNGNGATLGVAGGSTLGSSFGAAKVGYGSTRSQVPAVPMENKELKKIDTWLATTDMDSLRQELIATENEIERQRLKIGLNGGGSARPSYRK